MLLRPALARPLSRLSFTTLPKHLSRPFSALSRRLAEGDTGSLRSGGARSHDAWSRREKAAEDMYIKEREKQIMILLREKINAQEAQLDKDKRMLSDIEDQIGQSEEAWDEQYGERKYAQEAWRQ